MAHSDDLADAVVTLLQAAITTNLPQELKRAYAPREKVRDMQGKFVFVFCDGRQTLTRLTRGANFLREFKVVVTVEELYSDPAAGDSLELVPEDWIAERKTWVQNNIFATLNEAGLDPASRVAGSFWPNRCEITNEMDMGLLKEDKIFYSQVEIDYREFATT